MELEIKDTKTLGELQLEFNCEFPFLKIEFFRTPHKKGAHKSGAYYSGYLLANCRKIHTNGNLRVDRSNTVSELEQALWDQFGLSAQVFRKGGNMWIETSLSDSWTLERQNNEGKEINNHDLRI